MIDEGAFPEFVEGYWRPQKDMSNISKRTEHDKLNASYPWPEPKVIDGFDREEQFMFLENLQRIEQSKQTVRENYRGFSINRLTGETAGSSEFECLGWTWPDGYKQYIKLGVPPSREFYLFVTGEDLNCLPHYGRPFDADRMELIKLQHGMLRHGGTIPAHTGQTFVSKIN